MLVFILIKRNTGILLLLMSHNDSSCLRIQFFLFFIFFSFGPVLRFQCRGSRSIKQKIQSTRRNLAPNPLFYSVLSVLGSKLKMRRRSHFWIGFFGSASVLVRFFRFLAQFWSWIGLRLLDLVLDFFSALIHCTTTS